MRTYLLLLTLAIASGCSTTQSAQAPASARPASSAKAEKDLYAAMDAKRDRLIKAYVDCNGRASMKLAFYDETNIDALAETAAQQCNNEESAMRSLFQEVLGSSDGNDLTEQIIRKNHRFNVSMIVQTRQRVKEKLAVEPTHPRTGAATPPAEPSSRRTF